MIPRSSKRSRTTSICSRRSNQGDTALRTLDFNTKRCGRQSRIIGQQGAASVFGSPYLRKYSAKLTALLSTVQQRFDGSPLCVNHIMAFELEVGKLQLVVFTPLIERNRFIVDQASRPLARPTMLRSAALTLSASARLLR